jgi:trehalose 6-phosphate phosphatase
MKQEKLWMFDFDGMLTTRGSNYHATRLDPDCKEMLIMLVEKFPDRVAVISSRPLYNLLLKIQVQGLLLGGTSGLVWLLPGGEGRSFHSSFAKPLYNARAALLPELKKLELHYGVDIEDKLWSFTLHVPHLPRQIQKYIFNAVHKWRRALACTVFREPESVEIHLLPENTKIAVLPTLFSLLGLNSDVAQITYAGDDENDIPLMEWVLQQRGAVYTIGDKPLVSGGRIVKNPSLLAREIYRLCDCTESSGIGMSKQRSCDGTI